jgi:anti-anti-sigma factor
VPPFDRRVQRRLIAQELDGGITNVVLRGRLDTNGAGSIDLRFSAVAGARRAIVVDLSGVDFLGSLGIRVLLTGAKAVQRKGGRLVIVTPIGMVSTVLKMAGIEDLIPIFRQRDLAIAAVGS